MSDSILVWFGGHESSSFNFSWLLNLVDETVPFIIKPTFAQYEILIAYKNNRGKSGFNTFPH